MHGRPPHRPIRPHLLVPALLALAAGVTQDSVQAQGADPFQREGFVEFAENDLGNGARHLVFRSERFGDAAEVDLVLTAGGTYASATFVFARRLVSDHPALANELVAAFVEAVTHGVDESRVSLLAALIQSPDTDVRRGEGPNSTGCCALPPPPPEFVDAVAVLDGRSREAVVRLERSTLRFEDGPGLDGEPALVVRIQAGDDTPG